MHVSQQLLTAHHDELLRKAAARRLASQAKTSPATASRRRVRVHLKPRGLRPARLVSLG